MTKLDYGLERNTRYVKLGLFVLILIVGALAGCVGVSRRSSSEDKIEQMELEVLKPSQCNETTVDLWCADAISFTAILQEAYN